jgi:hypothetical protein
VDIEIRGVTEQGGAGVVTGFVVSKGQTAKSKGKKAEPRDEDRAQSAHEETK